MANDVVKKIAICLVGQKDMGIAANVTSYFNECSKCRVKVLPRRSPSEELIYIFLYSI